MDTVGSHTQLVLKCDWPLRVPASQRLVGWFDPRQKLFFFFFCYWFDSMESDSGRRFSCKNFTAMHLEVVGIVNHLVNISAFLEN